MTLFLRVALLAAVAVAVAACVPDGLAFRADDRLTILTPEDRSDVTFPLTIEWEIERFEIEPPGSPVREGAGHFALYLDRAPARPGKPVGQGSDIFSTTETRVVLDSPPPGFDMDAQHTATIVLVDGAGNRIGESAYDVTFEVEEP